MEKRNQKETHETKLLVGISGYMDELRRDIKYVAVNDNINVFIEGASGTGKEVIARSIHDKSDRRDAPFIPVNCAAIPEHLFESEFFGYERGAFTGAERRTKGKFEYANGGTLFLDEICVMPINQQAKLLRALQEKSFSRVGGNETINVDIRVISATNEAAKDQIKKNKFRDDLYSRLNGFKIRTEPLVNTPEDVVWLTRHFETKNKITADPRAKLVLYSYSLPGNVRELEKYSKIICNYDYFIKAILNSISEECGYDVAPNGKINFWDDIFLQDRPSQDELISEALKYNKINNHFYLSEFVKATRTIRVIDELSVDWGRIAEAYEAMVLIYSYPKQAKGELSKMMGFANEKLYPKGYEKHYGIKFDDMIACLRGQDPSLIINTGTPLQFIFCWAKFHRKETSC